MLVLYFCKILPLCDACFLRFRFVTKGSKQLLKSFSDRISVHTKIRDWTMEHIPSTSIDPLESQQIVNNCSKLFQENSTNSNLWPSLSSIDFAWTDTYSYFPAKQTSYTDLSLINVEDIGKDNGLRADIISVEHGEPLTAFASSPTPVMPETIARPFAFPSDIFQAPAVSIGLKRKRRRNAVDQGEEGTAPPITRGVRGQLAYDTQQMDARTAKRLLENRASAARSQQRRIERMREAEAALERTAEENSALRAQLAMALRFLEQLGYSRPTVLAPAWSATRMNPTHGGCFFSLPHWDQINSTNPSR